MRDFNGRGTFTASSSTPSKLNLKTMNFEESGNRNTQRKIKNQSHWLKNGLTIVGSELSRQLVSCARWKYYIFIKAWKYSQCIC